MARIRPMQLEDVTAADAVAWAAIGGMVPPEFVPDPAVRAARARLRLEHLLGTDPDGAWVAEDSWGEVAGVGVALVREGVWGLSLLAVRPDLHHRGIGRHLLDATLRTADGSRGGLIVSSSHPAAMRSYARAGFALRPSVDAAGIVRRDAIPTGLRARPGHPDEDRETIDAASRHVRGATHGEDVGVLVAQNSTLLVLPGRGFAVANDGSVTLLAALDEEAASDLLWSAWAHGTRGASVHLDFLTAGQDWAIRAALEAGLSLTPAGPVFTRGRLGTLRPFVPSGAFL